MSKLLLSLIIGMAAGVIDIIPMFLQKLDKYDIVSAFIQWVIVAFVIFHIQFGVDGWFKGLIVSIVMALPVIALVVKTDPKSALPMLVMSAVLGSLIGFIAHKYVR